MKREFERLQILLFFSNTTDGESGDCNWDKVNEALVALRKRIDDALFIEDSVALTFESSWGSIDVNEKGYVIAVHGESMIRGEKNPLYNIQQVNLKELKRFFELYNIELNSQEDILNVGYWTFDGVYTQPSHSFREEIFGNLLKKKKIVDEVVSMLKKSNVDVIMMEDILEDIGMSEQVFQRRFNSTNFGSDKKD